ncbi:hypothetical protein B1808_04730 [Pseudofulvimonas gallinarii]|uniref:Zinc-dependent peptidase n=1 Tax=Pseudofulvimonas gallinarii TaxID=634155 RepID=A0A4R3LL55_9GAMM|nr:M90 family metallopeptidase [Pseudofulvimonas gallinarii]TCT00306.1 hypothetical protein EDC25_10374 [Pseudofulvimonas gallinarii]THD14147.1 hypothetical protein B1808_04730 [Pseudofulvimonas gallinarii]
MLGWLKRRSEPPVISDEAWFDACADIRWLDRLPPGLLDSLRALSARFLRDKCITGSHDLELDDDDRLRIAILACLPVTRLGYDWLRGWSQVIVYQGQFRVRRSWHDDDTGVVTEDEDWLAGEAWHQGPLILSLEDILADLDAPYDGFNLVAHEVAHKLDMLDGACDGVPPLPDRATALRWQAIFSDEYRRFCKAVDAGEETVMDPYAAEAPDEFFAVASETFFSAPDLLAAGHPALHAELRAFYGFELVLPEREGVDR